MSGFEILGAVAASLQLVDTCSTIVQALLRMPSDAKLMDRVEVHCKYILKHVSDSLSYQSPEYGQVSRVLAEELQRIRSAIERRKRNRFFRCLGSGDEYRQQLLVAMENHNCAVTLLGTATVQKLLDGQQTLSQDMLTMLEKLSILRNEIQQLNGITHEMKLGLQSINEKTSRSEPIVEEFTSFRIQQPIMSTLTGQNPSAGPTPAMGTMAEYLREIWRTGSTTTDQDIWECYYDIVSVYTKYEIPVDLRFCRSGPYWPEGLWDHVSCYNRIPFIQGTRRFRWTYVISQDSSKYMCDHIEDAVDLLYLRLILMFLVSSKDDYENDNVKGRFQLIEEHDNPNVANVHYRMHKGGTLTALERINCLIQHSRDAQDNTILFGDVVGVNDVPYFRNFLSMIPNPSRVWEVPAAFMEYPSETSPPQSDSNYSRPSERRICAEWSIFSRPFTWTNNLVHPWDIDWSEWADKTKEYFLKSLARARRPRSAESRVFDECHSLSPGCSGDTCHLCDELRVDEIPDDIQQTWNENYELGRIAVLEFLKQQEAEPVAVNAESRNYG